MPLSNIGLLSATDKTKLIAKFQSQIAGLEFSITSTNIRKEKALATATTIESNIATQTALANSYGVAKQSQTPNTALYLDFEEKETIANEKLAGLNRQKAKFGTPLIVESESNVEVLQARIDMLNQHIVELS
jgi:hypothetical protein